MAKNREVSFTGDELKKVICIAASLDPTRYMEGDVRDLIVKCRQTVPRKKGEVVSIYWDRA